MRESRLIPLEPHASRLTSHAPRLNPMTSKPSYLTWWIWAVYAVLFAASIPWYWPADAAEITLGLPTWAAVSVLGSAAISSFTAWLFITRWPKEDDDL